MGEAELGRGSGQAGAIRPTGTSGAGTGALQSYPKWKGGSGFCVSIKAGHW